MVSSVRIGTSRTCGALDGIEKRVQADVPPDFFTVIDTIGFDEQVDILVVFRRTRKRSRVYQFGEIYRKLWTDKT